MHPDERVAALAARQQGNVTRAQLRRAGLTDRAIARRVATGRLHRRYRSVYLVGHTAPARYADEMSAALACDGVVSHRSAAEVFEIVLRRDPRREIDVTVLSSSRRRHPGIRVHRQPALQRVDIGFTDDGLPITSPARALLDFAIQAELRELERAFHEALVQRLITRRDIEAALARAPGHHCTPLIARLLRSDAGPTLTRSEAEELMLGLIRSARLPRPEVNARLHGYEVDFLWRARRLVVEVDSGRWHGHAAALERDHRKNAHLRSRGHEVLRYTYTQIRDDRDAVVAELARATAAPLR